MRNLFFSVGFIGVASVVVTTATAAKASNVVALIPTLLQ